MSKGIRILIGIGIVAILLCMIAYVGIPLYLRARMTKSTTFTTAYGDTFRLTAEVSGLMHDVHLRVTLKQRKFLHTSNVHSEGLTEEAYRGLDEGLSWGQAVVKSYQYEDMRIYQFHWCYIYTLDDGKTFHGLGLDEPTEDETVIRLIANLA